jgi:hypothetical protein
MPAASTEAAPLPRSKAGGWVAIALGAAAVAAGATMIVVGPGESHTALKVPQVDTAQYSDTVLRGRVLNYGGAGAIAAGVLAAGLGLYGVW